ncbi:MAG: ribosome recycling factor [Erysipelotrichaceae bacterium]|nr:ribosome recycling factor [Erysipelotrichaceae bacterium]MCI9313115.1 ribosome recycling factor [Erysipelotrichaceae bacterium]
MEYMNMMNDKMKKAIESLESNLRTIRTGRANPTILDRVELEYYGSMTPLNQLSSISVVEGRQLMIKPFDRTMLKEVERAVAMADLGLVPQNDGNVIRIMIPALTEDRRKELSKDAHRMGEDAKVAVRNIRRDALNAAKKDNELTEDLKKAAQDDIQKATDQFVKQIDTIVEAKCSDIMSV